MPKRASTKTQRRLKQQQSRDPYALTDDVYNDRPTFRVGGLVTIMGVLQFALVVMFGGLIFGRTLLFCGILLAAPGLTLLNRRKHCIKQLSGFKRDINRLLELRRSALDYSLTLSIAQKSKYEQTQNEQNIAEIPSCPTSSKVVPVMEVKQGSTKPNSQSTSVSDSLGVKARNMKHQSPHCTLAGNNREKLIVEKPRANSELTHVLQHRPLLPLQQARPRPKKLKKAISLPKQQEVPPQKLTKASSTIQSEPKSHHSREHTKISQEETRLHAISQEETHLHAKAPTPTIPEPVEKKSMESLLCPDPVVKKAEPIVPTFPKRKTLMEVVYDTPVLERELVVTRKVILYQNSKDENLDEQTLEQEVAKEVGHIYNSEEFPPLSRSHVLLRPRSNLSEPNFLMDISLEPISKSEKKLTSLNSLRLQPVGSPDLRSMLNELDAMHLELEAALDHCDSLLNCHEPNALPELKTDDELIFC